MVGGLDHRLRARLGNEGGGDVEGGQVHDEERVAGLIVIHEDRRGFERRNVVEFLLEIQGSTRDHHDLVGQALRVFRRQGGRILGRTETRLHILVVSGGQVAKTRDALALEAARALVGDVTTGC